MKKKSREKIKILIFSVCALVFLVIIFSVLSRILPQYYYKTGKAVDAGGFAMCLSNSGVKMYGAYWCSHRQNQKKIFGVNFKYVDYVECDVNGENSQADLCSSKGIEGYPTWEIKGKLYPGEQSMAKLSELSGCKA